MEQCTTYWLRRPLNVVPLRAAKPLWSQDMPEDQQQEAAELQLNSDSMSPSFRTESGVTGGVLGGDALEREGGLVAGCEARRLGPRLLVFGLLLLLVVAGRAGVSFKVWVDWKTIET